MSDTFFETIPNQTFSTVNSRVWEHPGAVVDLGCAGWDWCAPFIGKKRVVGADPYEKRTPPGVELISALVGPYNGTISFQGSTSVSAPSDGPSASMWAWKTFNARTIDKNGIAILKLNIEGGEYPLLASMDETDFENIDQIAVSFHDFCWPRFTRNTRAMVGYLESLGYVSKQIHEQLNWWLFY
jgi:hypothetical protein